MRRYYSGPVDCLRQVWRAEGVRGLYKGLGATAWRESPSYGIYFLTYEELKVRLPGGSDSKLVQLVAGGTAGSVAWASIYPFDVVKSVIQTLPEGASAQERSMGYVIRQQYRRHGVPVFFRGLWTCVLRAFPVNGVQFVVYEEVKARLEGGDA